MYKLLLSYCLLFLIIFTSSCNSPLISGKFTEVVVLHSTNNKEIILAEINDETEIKEMIHKINSSPRKRSDKIQFEQGPQGKLVFKGENTITFKFFTDSGDVLTSDYLIDTNFNFANSSSTELYEVSKAILD